MLERADAATGAASIRTVAMPQISGRLGFAPQGTTSRSASLDPKVAAVAVEPDGAVWAVSAYGDDAPSGWGAVVRFPAP